MQFTWDENKRQSNLGKHGFDFVDVSQVFEGATFTFEDEPMLIENSALLHWDYCTGEWW